MSSTLKFNGCFNLSTKEDVRKVLCKRVYPSKHIRGPLYAGWDIVLNEPVLEISNNVAF